MNLGSLNTKAFDVEHSLSLYAHSYAHFPAKNLYDKDLASRLGKVVKKCHIYMIGLSPVINFSDFKQISNDTIELLVTKNNKSEVLEISFEHHITLIENESMYYIFDENNDQIKFGEDFLGYEYIKAKGPVPFEVLYIGQAYGKDGRRNAIDRLKKHEKLQKISLLGVPKDHQLEVILLEIQPNNQMFTFLNPFAKDSSSGEERIRKGLDKLFNTKEIERITLYEASFIRYFEPKFNKEFKDSFPSTRMKVLADCYDKDFSGIVSEIYFDDFYFGLFSKKQEPQKHYMSKIKLHTNEDRNMFFLEH